MCSPIGRSGPASVALFALSLAACAEESRSPTEPDPSASATAVAGTLVFRQLSAGTLHTCGVTTDNLGYCWGGAGGGELGTGSFQGSLTPVPVAGGRRFLEIRAGTTYTCGLTTDNRAYCWGANFFGQLGDGTTTSRPTPGPVSGGRRFRQLRAGKGHVCALTFADVAFCWGDNSSGQVGDGTTTERHVPVRVAGGLLFKQVRGGGSHTCALTAGSRAYCWGSNAAGQLGDGTRTRRLKPVPVSGQLAFTGGLIAGGAHTCGVASEKRPYCWGDNTVGQTGTGSSLLRILRPRAIADNRRFNSVSAGGDHGCGLILGTSTWCWGRAYYGVIGDGGPLYRDFNVHIPVPVLNGYAFTGLTSGASHTCAIGEGGQAWCWGWNEAGQLGDGTTDDRSAPVAVAGL
jgi:alpha-tubulin suppressor-like RCC1 family protein